MIILTATMLEHDAVSDAVMGATMDIESLYPLVTEAIRRAELLAEARAPEATSAHREVSLLEEKIAELLPASEAEGALARRGAVRAALAAGDFSGAYCAANHPGAKAVCK